MSQSSDSIARFTRADLTPGYQYKYDKLGWDFNKNLQLNALCPRPFDTLSITQDGLVHACECAAWLPIPIGNILDFNSFEEVMTHSTAVELQASILDKSYRYCDITTCSFSKGTVKPDRLRNLSIGIDRSCNLSCPSCREELIFYKRGKDYDRSIALGKHIGTLIKQYPHPLSFTLATDGELFASHAYRSLLESVELSAGDVLKVQTNGMLMRTNWHILERFEPFITEVQVSMDAGEKSLFEKIRRGGNWEKTIDAIQWVVAKNIPVSISIVVQEDNVHSIVDAVQYYNSLGVYRVYLTAESDWGTKQDFVSIVDPTHNLHATLRDQVNRVKALGFDTMIERSLTVG